MWAGQIVTEDKNINKVVKEFNKYVFQAAHEAILRGATKYYIPYWWKQLDVLQEEVEKKIKEVEKTAIRKIITITNMRRQNLEAIRKS